MRRVTLLGPLNDEVDLAAEIEAFGVDGPVALITAGWEEGERNDAEIDRRLGGGSRNLGLYGRRLDVLSSDSEYAEAERLLRTQLDDLREQYQRRVRAALDGVDVMRKRFAGTPGGAGEQLTAAIEAVRTIDESHAAAMAAAYDRFHATHPPHHRSMISRHRDEVASIVGECAAIAIAGGHVGVLNDCLHLCNLAALIEAQPLLVWSSGCMAISEHIVVIDDDDPAARPAELYDIGIGVARGLVALPVSERLHGHDADARALLAARFAPRVCVVLDAGDRLELSAGLPADLGTVGVVAPDGRLVRGTEAA
ncbi:MAG TPA: hypothetical protein VND88_01895 [Candidatus Acidoferrales bacterium]|nr:hypothetical protein [Candidatus Acidoferrales bacterium]